MDGSEGKVLALRAAEDQCGENDQLTEADRAELRLRAARDLAKEKRELHERRVARLRWSVIRLTLDLADTRARLEYQLKLGAELDARLDAALAAL